MKALVYTAPQTLEIRSEADPVVEPGTDERLVRVDSAGICGSDMHAWLGHDARRPAPLILGHEAAGIVTDGAEAGRRVTVNPLVTCGRCRWCVNGRENLCPDRQIISMPPRHGAFAELLRIPARNLITVPAHVPLEHAALAEPIACGWHASRLANEQLWLTLPDARTLVIGGGAIGVGAALSLICHGAENPVVVEPNELRREFLAEQGEIDVRSPDSLVDEAPFDLVIDAVGIEATRAHASAAVEAGGLIVHIGLGSATGGLDIRRMTLQEIGFIGTYTYTNEDFRKVAAAIFDARLGRLDWIERRPLTDGAQAFTDIRAGQVAAPKVVLQP